MSDFVNGEERRFKTFRIYLDTQSVARYEQITDDGKPTLSYAINDWLYDYLAVQEIKQLLKQEGNTE